MIEGGRYKAVKVTIHHPLPLEAIRMVTNFGFRIRLLLLPLFD